MDEISAIIGDYSQTKLEADIKLSRKLLLEEKATIDSYRKETIAGLLQLQAKRSA